MHPISVVFLGSFLHYSAKVLESLLADSRIDVVGVVTTPPHPTGEDKNPVHKLAEKHDSAVFTPEKLDENSLSQIPQANIFLTAGYGKLLPVNWLSYPTKAALNLHFSLLPHYRGANPGEWALLAGETETGVTLIEMSPKFDTGKIVAKYSVAIAPQETRETLYEKLYVEGGAVLPEMIAAYCDFRENGVVPQPNSAVSFHLPPVCQPEDSFFYARRLSREDGFVEWDVLQKVMLGETVLEENWPPLYQEICKIDPAISLPQFLDRAPRALAGYPTLWTNITTPKGEVRMKLLETHLENGKLVLDQVHLAGKNPTRWNEVKNTIIQL